MNQAAQPGTVHVEGDGPVARITVDDEAKRREAKFAGR